MRDIICPSMIRIYLLRGFIFVCVLDYSEDKSYRIAFMFSSKIYYGFFFPPSNKIMMKGNGYREIWSYIFPKSYQCNILQICKNIYCLCVNIYTYVGTHEKKKLRRKKIERYRCIYVCMSFRIWWEMEGGKERYMHVRKLTSSLTTSDTCKQRKYIHECSKIYGDTKCL